MPLHTHFLEWNQPVLHTATRTLLGFADDPERLDISNITCVVPTQNAARRLREQLARHAAETNRAVLPGPIVQPQSFLTPHPSIRQAPTATAADQFAAWIHVLHSVAPQETSSVFPGLPPTNQRRAPWLVGTAKRLIQLRANLAENGHNLRSAAELIGLQDEPERWQELAKLEIHYLALLKRMQRTDPETAKIHAAQKPRLPDGTDTLVVIATPAPVPLVVQAWKSLADKHPVHVFIHAPESLGNAFDEWGQPTPEYWRRHRIDIPNPDSNLLVRANPAEQAHSTRHLIQQLPNPAGRVTIGAPTPEVGDVIQKELARHDIATFNPAGIPIATTAVVSFTLGFANFAMSESFDTAADCIRHPDFLRYLKNVAPETSTESILRELSKCATNHLPQTLADLVEHARAFPALNTACTQLLQLNTTEPGTSAAKHLRYVLTELYEHHRLNPGNPEDITFEAAAKEIRQILDWLDDDPCNKLLDSTDIAFAILKNLLEHRNRYPDRDPDAIDILGWLELHWDDAPNLVLTNMNDGVVPESFAADLFLPESARKRLGMHDNESRFARDAYLFAAMIESRRQAGSVVAMTAKFNAANDPLKPSRLLFLCPDTELPLRARTLFAELESEHKPPPRTITWKLAPPHRPPPNRIGVTALKKYLECPFRFYLGSVLNMNEVDHRKTEMDALDFGTVAHHALETLRQHPQLTRFENLRDLLLDTLHQNVEQRFGQHLSAALQIQRHSLAQRLTALAQQEAEIRDDGWETVLAEEKATLEFSGLVVSGKIDRVDHRDGHYRVIDYKTGEKARNPDTQLFTTIRNHTPDYAKILDENGRDKAWADLQLPVYTLMMQQRFPNAASIQTGYFNLPKAVTETGLQFWNKSSTALLHSAGKCVHGIAADIQSGRFWPPTEKIEYDTFERILFGGADGIDATGL